MVGLDFVHLHVHSSFSLLEGALTVARLAELAKADHQPALALTDTDNMFGALEFSEKLSGCGIQPIVGCALAVGFGDTDHGPRNGNAQPERTRVVLLAARPAGYRSLMRLNSRAFLDTPANEPPRLKVEWLDGETAGIIALTGGPGDNMVFYWNIWWFREALFHLHTGPFHTPLLHHPGAAPGVHHAQLVQLVAIGLLVHLSGGTLTFNPLKPGFSLFEIHVTSVVGRR